MKKKILTILSICALAVAGLAFGMLQPVEATAATATTYYVSSSGSDEGSGKSDSPYATLDKALTMAVNGDIISLKDTVKLDDWTAHGKTVTITGGGGLDASGDSAVEINDSVTFTNMSWIVDSDAFVYANGYKTTIGENVSWSNEIRIFGGGQAGTTVASTDLTVLSGVYTHIYGGSNQGGTVTGNTNLTVGGTTNNSSAVDTAIKNHTGKYYIFGGGHSTNTIKGSTNLVVKDQAKAVYVFGASHGYSDTRYISGSANTTILNGTMMGVYGGSQGGYASNGASIRIEGGKIQQVFGGSESWPFSMGDIKLQIIGGTITRRIYGGCYNATKSLSTTFKTDYKVERGKIIIEIGGNANIDFSSTESDKGIFAFSRYSSELETDTQIVFTSETAYNAYKNKLGNDYSGAVWNLSGAKAYHYYTYAANDNVLTQECAYHSDLAATAALSITGDCKYTGNALTPVGVEFSEDWEYDKPTIVYQNNVKIGAATATLGVGGVNAEQKFVIVDTPTVLGGSVRTSAPSGLRFQSKIDANLKDSGAEFGTLYIPKAVLGANELTVDTNAVNVKQTKWATDSVHPEDYEEGYEYFNAVLTGIPEAHYDKEIVARSYVYANGQYYYSETIERSIAQVSAYALRDGYTNDILYDYVDKALEGATVSMTSKLTLIETETYQLALSENKGYVAIWSSSNKDVATVDENGKITALKNEGTATITAKLGNLEVKCEVTVNQKWTGYY